MLKKMEEKSSPVVNFHPIISSIQKIALYETKSVSNNPKKSNHIHEIQSTPDLKKYIGIFNKFFDRDFT